DLAGCKKTNVTRLEKQNSPLQDAQKIQTSHPPNPGAPKRALSRARVFRVLIPLLLRGVAEAALYCAHRATTASSWGLCEQEGHLAGLSCTTRISFVAFYFLSHWKGR